MDKIFRPPLGNYVDELLEISENINSRQFPIRIDKFFEKNRNTIKSVYPDCDDVKAYIIKYWYEENDNEVNKVLKMLDHILLSDISLKRDVDKLTNHIKKENHDGKIFDIYSIPGIVRPNTREDKDKTHEDYIKKDSYNGKVLANIQHLGSMDGGTKNE